MHVVKIESVKSEALRAMHAIDAMHAMHVRVSLHAMHATCV
jgi:hypothetical protein